MIRYRWDTENTQGFVPWFEWNSTLPCDVDTQVTYGGLSTLRCNSHSVRSPLIRAGARLPRDVVHTATWILRQDVPVGVPSIIVDYAMQVLWLPEAEHLEPLGRRFRLGPDWQAVGITFLIPDPAAGIAVCVGFDPNPSSNASGHHDAFHVAELRID